MMLDEMHLRQHILDAAQRLERCQPIVRSRAHGVAVDDASSRPRDRPDHERQLQKAVRDLLNPGVGAASQEFAQVR